MKLSYVRVFFISCSLPVIAVGKNPLSIRDGAGESDKISLDRYLEEPESTLHRQLGNESGTERSDDPEPLVINGANAKPGRYPYYAVSVPWGCGGSLVGKRAILTAAHCVGVFKDRVEVGLTTWRDQSGQIISIQRVIRHPRYNSKTFDYDYAIVILTRAPKHKPVCLARKSFKKYWAKKSLTVMGFGSTKSYRMDQKGKEMKGRGGATSQLQYTHVNQVSPASCKARYRGEYVSSRMMCALGPNKKDACQGDSGGPLIKPGRNAGSDVLVGVVSWGIGCGTSPGVYSDVTAALRWIVTTINQNKAGPIAPGKICAMAMKK